MIETLKKFFGKNRINTSELTVITSEEPNIIIDIGWEDLSTDSIMGSALSRNGLYGHATSCLLILNDGREYIPLNISDHWEAYINSPKFRPKTITYQLLK